MFEIKDLLTFREFGDFVPEIIYCYLFKGFSVGDIEDYLFKTKELKGWLSKTFLNLYGVDTSKESKNRGRYSGRTVADVVKELNKSSNDAHRRVAKLLEDKYL